MMYKLYLDDLRNPTNSYPTSSNEEWSIVRNYDAFVYYIKRNGLPFLVSFDHDLGVEHYCKEVDPKDYKEKTGLDCAKWLIEYCLDNNYSLPAWKVHSANPSGAANIRGLLERFQQFQNEND